MNLVISNGISKNGRNIFPILVEKFYIYLMAAKRDFKPGVRVRKTIGVRSVGTVSRKKPAHDNYTRPNTVSVQWDDETAPKFYYHISHLEILTKAHEYGLLD